MPLSREQETELQRQLLAYVRKLKQEAQGVSLDDSDPFDLQAADALKRIVAQADIDETLSPDQWSQLADQAKAAAAKEEIEEQDAAELLAKFKELYKAAAAERARVQAIAIDDDGLEAADSPHRPVRPGDNVDRDEDMPPVQSGEEEEQRTTTSESVPNPEVQAQPADQEAENPKLTAPPFKLDDAYLASVNQALEKGHIDLSCELKGKDTLLVKSKDGMEKGKIEVSPDKGTFTYKSGNEDSRVAAVLAVKAALDKTLSEDPHAVITVKTEKVPRTEVIDQLKALHEAGVKKDQIGALPEQYQLIVNNIYDSQKDPSYSIAAVTAPPSLGGIERVDSKAAATSAVGDVLDILHELPAM
ncbi:hypothetical protein [Piscirickettsia litoralis]|uniref:Uncharacterized protein n=1 Tax=Piscirickettsia litoralis TaxID=1891921 RepID=A0ABX3A3L0_9GAMM|nr:hypothetical protein [Piscirickettsia litoralis]ODN43452.1 hypothetical protein BGC07_11645 [Piscirickettsia litoralis]